MKDICVELGMLTEYNAAKTDSPERKLLFDLWRYLGGEKTEQVYTECLKLVLSIIARYIDMKRIIPNENAPEIEQLDQADAQSGKNIKTDTQNVGFFQHNK